MRRSGSGSPHRTVRVPGTWPDLALATCRADVSPHLLEDLHYSRPYCFAFFSTRQYGRTKRHPGEGKFMLGSPQVSRFAHIRTDTGRCNPVSRMWGHPEPGRSRDGEPVAPGTDQCPGDLTQDTPAQDFLAEARSASGRFRAAGSAARRSPTRSLTCSRSNRRTANV